MAWEIFLHDGNECYTGDAPCDIFSLALSRLCIEYEERFGRKPKLIELTSIFNSVVSNKNFSDLNENQFVSFEYKITNLPDELLNEIVASRVDSSLEATFDFEAVYSDVEDPGYHLIVRTSNLSNSQEEDCIKIVILDVEDSVLICKYIILTDDIDDVSARRLIRKYLLEIFANNYYQDEASMIKFVNLSSGESSLRVMKIPTEAASGD